MARFFYFSLGVVLLYGCAFADRFSYENPAIRVNQVGYLTTDKKQGVVAFPSEDLFKIHDTSGEVLFEGKLLETNYWDKSDEEVAIADFSLFQKTGEYYITCGEVKSPTFTISERPYIDLVKAAAKSYYFNRASTTLDSVYSGPYHRPYSHADTTVYVHATAASISRPAGMKISTPYGWYDAGDYNKYVVNSGISTYTLLLAYQHNADFFDTLDLNIPESGNQQADVLDEILWNIKWMETMQDPSDGGVYHKTTTANFEGFIFPPEASGKRYVVAKSTGATLDFSAVLAMSARLIAQKDTAYAKNLLEKAKRAWKWARENPNVTFKNPDRSHPDFPPVTTGGYADVSFADEFFWAACELYLATGNEAYLEYINMKDIQQFHVPNWRSVETLGLISLSSAVEGVVSQKLKKEASDQLMLMAERLMEVWRKAPYKITLNHFAWGSNSDILNQGMVLVNAYRVFGNSEYYQAALSSLDYVLGKNAVGYCFVTGFGSKKPMKIHHRQSASDNVENPIPGLLVGGPNPNNIKQDCGAEKYPNHLPAKCYIDEVCSYSTNEVAINWNAPLVYLSSTLQSIYLNDHK